MRCGLLRTCGWVEIGSAPARRDLDLIKDMRAHHRQPGAGAGADEGEQGEEVCERVAAHRSGQSTEMEFRAPAHGQCQQTQAGEAQQPAGARTLVPIHREPQRSHEREVTVAA
jgi:hypothetical protein